MPRIENDVKNIVMKYLIAIIMFLSLYSGTCFGWDGFDSDSADLVEIIPDAIPNINSTVEVRNYETDQTETCIVESVTRNRRTIELVVRDPNGKRRILVMEMRP